MIFFLAKEVAMSAATNREERLQIMLEQDEMRAVDDFRFKYRLPSRAAAVRELLKRGLAATPTGEAGEHSRSKDFGVLGIANGSGFKKPESSGEAE
jgi:hypothetical protein